MKGAKRGFRRGVTPFSSLGNRIALGAQGKEAELLKKLKPGAGKMLQTSASKRAEGALKTARAKYATATKEYDYNKKGKRIKGKRFSSTKTTGKLGVNSAQALKENITKAKSGLAKTYAPKFRKELGAKAIGKFIKQRGAKGLIKAAVKTLGPIGASKLAARLAASGVMKAGGFVTGGVTAALSTLLDGYTIYQLSKIVATTLRDESGGVRAPGEMLFGSKALGKMPGQ